MEEYPQLRSNKKTKQKEVSVCDRTDVEVKIEDCCEDREFVVANPQVHPELNGEVSGEYFGGGKHLGKGPESGIEMEHGVVEVSLAGAGGWGEGHSGGQVWEITWKG